MEHSNYHRILRISLVVCAIALVFESGIVSESTAQISQDTHSYLANAIGMSAAVQPTELNLLTAELTTKQTELEAREAALREREISVNLSTGSTANSGNNDTATYILASILFILLVLILLNYVLDFLRAREEQEEQTVKTV